MATKLKISRGATFRKQWAWYAGDDVVKNITSIVRGFPTVVTVTSHGLPSTDIPVALLDVDELSTLDSTGNPSFATQYRILATKLSTSTFSVEVDSSFFTPYVSGGFLVYLPPRDLTGYVARAQFRTSATSATILLELTTENGGIELGGVEGTIDLLMTDAQTTDFPKAFAEWNIELVAPGPGDVVRFDSGVAKFSPDVNRPV